MAEAAITFLLENLKVLAVHYRTLISSADSELKNLRMELDSMKSFLEDAASQKSKSKGFKTWENQIREVVYKIEDVIDECVTQAAIDSSRKIKLSFSRGDLAEKVRSIREKEVKPVFEKARVEFATLPMPDVADEHSRNAVNRIRQIEPMVDENIVGFEDAIEELIGDLKVESSEVEVISIVGMPGLGKTTVASKIYHDKIIDYEFTKRIWINVSEVWNRRDIYLSILKKCTNEDMSSQPEIDLATKVKEKLNQVKFLLVADDVWTVDAWQDIRVALPMNKGSCKVLITSRYDQVALNANPRRDPHRLRFLTGEESWKLLQMEVYGGEGNWPTEWENIGKKIATDCGGLPLALKVVGGILKSKISTRDATKTAWKKVSESVGEYTIAKDKERSMEKIIALSYDKLPYHLRDCFLYFGVFPEDFEMSTWNLKCLWIAEGFVREEFGDLSLEEIADEYIKELINRNLVMVGRKNALGEAKTCYVHDMIREFCKKEGGHELNFAQEIKMLTRHGIFKPPVSEIANFRRVGIHSHVMKFFNDKPDGPHTRSFLCFSKESIDVPLESSSLVLKAFPLLRVFEGNTMKFSKFPIKLRELIHLRYLSLAAGDNFKALPEDIGKLWNLQTLVITTSSRTFEIRADISTMERLRHLKTKGAIILTKDKKSAPNQNLQTLSRLSTSSCKDEVLSKAPNIKVLGIHGDLDTLLNNVNLQMLACLTKLKLIHVGQVAMSKLPKSSLFPPNMRILSLSATKLDWGDMSSTLSLLLKLEVLKLQEYAFKGEKWDDNGKGFDSLHSLQIERSDLITWSISKSSFPSLGSLVLKNCEKLVAIPLGLAKSLHTLEIERVTKTAFDSALNIDKQKNSIAGGKLKLIIAPGDWKAHGNQQLES